mmetsp:Transcript_11288/g.11328  ORF Transcript_11288/g.11328 Transcript_11288/m.11328 type:complete len:923 (+) Transcript_11288:182-2950(+)
MMIPPPNVTGSLHLGHALTSSIEDALARWSRMQGKETLWLPGVDHAGIATQSVVEKQIFKEEGKTRHDYGREEFTNKIWEWKEKYGNRICDQFRRMGVSTDWSRMCFTLDDKLSKAVVEAFVRMWEKGLIYRANRLVNWSCYLRTAISDLEVEFEDITESTWIKVPNHDGLYEFGVIHSFDYQIETGEKITVATTRLETMLGDVAVAVHPDDPRYKHLIGRKIIHPFIPEREMRVVADSQLVDMTFGTGAVKITPAHDYRDFECGERHGLATINIFTEDGKINENGGRYAGMMRFDCRNQIEKDLAELGLYKEKANNTMRLGFCSRSGDVIEPYLKPQWYVNCNDLAARACEAVRNGELKILPDFNEKTWFRWLENIKDWCISRQLWWGHRCPAYLVTVKDANGEVKVRPRNDSNENWVCARNHEEAMQKAQKFKTAENDIIEIEQDEDVLDTWFSSGLFPFSTLGWPDVENPDFKAFYPGTILETGHDILFFWVARMVMMGLCLTDKLPFNTVYLHAMIRDAEGEKMSKSKGNVIDPEEVIDGTTLESLIQKVQNSNLSQKDKVKYIEKRKKEFPEGIPACGSDALRIGLLSFTIQGRDINLKISKVISFRQFMNKLWNVMKFTLSNLGEGFVPVEGFLSQKPKVLVNQWMVSRLSNTIQLVDTHFNNYDFGEAVQVLYSYWLHEFCDIYLEAIKPIMKSDDAEAKTETLNTLFSAVEKGLLLLHPMIPYVTEELYQRLPEFSWKRESISIAEYPKPIPELIDPEVERTMDIMMEIIRTARSIFQNLNLVGKKPKIYLRTSQEVINLIEPHINTIVTLSKAGSASCTTEVPHGCIMNPSRDVEVYLELAGMVNIEAEVKKLAKKRDQMQKLIEGLKKKMSLPQYEEKTPENVKAENSNKLATYNEELEKLELEITRLRELS